MTTAIIIVLLILLAAYYVAYCDIDINDEIYIYKHTGEQYKVIDKSFMFVTLSRVHNEPIKVFTFDFILNYIRYYV